MLMYNISLMVCGGCEQLVVPCWLDNYSEAYRRVTAHGLSPASSSPLFLWGALACSGIKPCSHSAGIFISSPPHSAHPSLHQLFFHHLSSLIVAGCRGGNSYPPRCWHHCRRWQNVDLCAVLIRPGVPPQETLHSKWACKWNANPFNW